MVFTGQVLKEHRQIKHTLSNH